MKTQKIRVIIDKLSDSRYLYDIKVNGYDWVEDINQEQNEYAINLYRAAGFNFKTYNKCDYVIYAIHPKQIESYINTYVNVNEYQHKMMCDLSGMDLEIIYKEDGNKKVHLKV